ncbi:MAG: Ig-like domain-containing protein [Gemmatimonadota bacterium]
MNATAKFTVALAAVVGGAACGADTGGTAPPGDLPPARIVSATTLPTTARATDVLPVTVRVLDVEGNPAQGIPVAWESRRLSPSGDPVPHGEVSGAGPTDEAGETTVAWRLGELATEQLLSATLASVPTLSLTFRLDVKAGVASVLSLSPDSLSFDALGDSAALMHVARDEYGNALAAGQLSLSSGDTLVARLSGDWVRSTGNGLTVVELIADGLRDVLFVRVQQSPRFATVGPSDRLLMVGDTSAVTATALDRNGFPIDGIAFTFVSVDPGIASVSDAGLVTGVAEGRAEIRARTVDSSPASGSVFISVFDPQPFVLRDIQSGSSHLCGLDAGGIAWCWGDDGEGQLGAGAPIDCGFGATSCSEYPIRMADVGLSLIGDHGLCGVRADGQGFCWGVGFLGDSTEHVEPAREPVAVLGPVGFLQIDGGGERVCGIGVDSLAYCWGAASPPLGDETFTERAAPTKVKLEERVRTISVSRNHSCAIAMDGAAWCWGSDGFGQLGDGNQGFSAVPVLVAGGLRFQTISVGDITSCGVAAGGDIHCWGSNVFGQLGIGDLSMDRSPVPVRAETPAGVAFKGVAVGSGHVCAIDTQGVLYCWGDDHRGQLGVDIAQEDCSGAPCASRPTRVSSDERFAQVSLGFSHSCALAEDGVTYCWGGAGPALGIGRFPSNVPRPVRVDGRFSQ